MKVIITVDENTYFMYLSDGSHIFHVTPSGKIHRLKHPCKSNIFKKFYAQLKELHKK